MDPISRDGLIDARRLAFLDKYLGQPMQFQGYYDDPSHPGMLPALMVNAAWKTLESSVIARLIIQSDPAFSVLFTYDGLTDFINPVTDVTTSLAGLVSAIGALSPTTLNSWIRASYVLDSFRISGSADQGAFADTLVTFPGMNGIDIVQNAVAQGLAISYTTDGTLVLDNSPTDGILVPGYGHESGLEYSYEAGDGKVQINYTNPGWLRDWEGWQPNRLYVGMNSTDINSNIDQNGNMTLSDGILGDQLTIASEAIGGITQHGVQMLTFKDGVEWTQPEIAAGSGQTSIGSTYEHVAYDPQGYANIITSTGQGNKYLYSKGYGQVTVSMTDVGNTVQFLSGILGTDIEATINSNGDLLLTDGVAGDLLTLQNNYTTNYAGALSRTSAILWNGGRITLVGKENADLPFTWRAHAPNSTLTGSTYGLNNFMLTPDVSNVVAGNSSLGSGMNVFMFGHGSGNSTANMNGGTGHIQFNSDVIASQVIYQSTDAGDLIIKLRGSTDSITFTGALVQTGCGTYSSVNKAIYSNGTSQALGYTGFNQGAPIIFTWEADSAHTGVTGSGFGENRFILAPGSSTVQVGTGNHGGSIQSTVVFHAGDGNAIIDTRGGWTTLEMGAGIAKSDILFGSDTNGSLIVSFKNNPTDKITVLHDLFPAWNGIGSGMKNITFSDGTNMQVGLHDWYQGAPITFTETATATQTTLVGSLYGSNTFVLAPGNDTVTTGNANLGGSYYNDVIYHKGDGNALIKVESSLASLKLTSGITPQDVLLQGDSSNDLIVKFRNSPNDSITFTNVLYTDPWGVLSQMRDITYADGTITQTGIPFWGQGAPLNYTYVGTPTETTLVGSNMATNTFELHDGNNGLTTVKHEMI